MLYYYYHLFHKQKKPTRKNKNTLWAFPRKLHRLIPQSMDGFLINESFPEPQPPSKCHFFALTASSSSHTLNHPHPSVHSQSVNLNLPTFYLIATLIPLNRLQYQQPPSSSSASNISHTIILLSSYLFTCCCCALKRVFLFFYAHPGCQPDSDPVAPRLVW